MGYRGGETIWNRFSCELRNSVLKSAPARAFPSEVFILPEY